VRLANGEWQTLHATWLGRFVLDGYAIADEYFDGQSIAYAFKEPMAAHAYTRATYTNISEKRFTWRGEKSDDEKTWSEFMVVEVCRSEE
jgi:hypothetical protein